jgi:hypothetical protein
MDLISREAAIEAVKIPDDGCNNPSERHGIIFARVEARRAIQSIPSVPAVPLDKLCEWLERNAAGRWNGLEYTAAGWKDELTRRMEEQDAKEEI